MKQVFALCAALVLVAGLAGCGGGGEASGGAATEVSRVVDPAVPADSVASVAQESAPEQEASAPHQSAGPQREDSMVVAFEGVEYLVTFNFPEGIFFSGGNVEQEEYGIVPEDIYDSALAIHGPNPKIGWVYKTIVAPEQVSGDRLVLYKYETEEEIYTYSEDDTLPVYTFYWLGDILVSTAPVENMLATSFYLPCGPTEYVGFSFFHNGDSAEKKAFLEGLVANVVIEPVL